MRIKAAVLCLSCWISPISSDGQELQPASYTAQDQPAINGETFEPGRVLAIVGGQPILAGDQMLMINEVLQSQGADVPAAVRERMIEQGMRELLPRSIERKMLYQEALLL
ncbi:MAG: hypothetical protein Q8M16_18925, partial [Pirellulaceae bacterium]|nr:hypothetical protein [Pirellulaceae bacterium]